MNTEALLARLEQELVSRFRSVFVDAAHEDITCRTLRWTAGHQLFGSLADHAAAYLKQAIVASTFGTLCAPKGAGHIEQLRASKFTSIFLYLDDTTSPEVMPEEQWQLFHSALMKVAERGGYEENHEAIVEWLKEIDGIGGERPTALRDFRRSFVDYCQSLAEERHMDFSAMDRASFMHLRRRTIFVEPFVNHWRVSMGIEVPRDDPLRAFMIKAQALAGELIILANDLGSLERDTTSETTEMSVVLFYSLEHGGSVELGAAQAVREYNGILRAFRDLAAHPQEAKWKPPLFDLLTHVIEGNLDTMLLLRQRYEGSATWLDRLDRLTDATAPSPR